MHRATRATCDDDTAGSSSSSPSSSTSPTLAGEGSGGSTSTTTPPPSPQVVAAAGGAEGMWWVAFWPLRVLWRFILSIFQDPRRARAVGRVQWGSGGGNLSAQLEEMSVGNPLPERYEGTFGEALQAAGAMHRFLVVYLHSQEHWDSPRFVSQVLCHPSVVSYLSENYVFWAVSASSPEGYRLGSTLGASSYPFIGVLGNVQGQRAVLDTFQGSVTTDILVARLIRVMEESGAFLAIAREEEVQAVADRGIMQTQNQEYEEALAADRKRKEEAQRLEEEERRLRKAAAEAAREEEERRCRAEEEARLAAERTQREREEDRKTKLGRLPPEPPADASDITKIAIRLPSGTRIGRKFHVTDTLQSLYDFVDISQDDVGADQYVL
eukprot:CAMPEP_0119123484 /NCGR_PEP_ID=MMETSP1310-20130426/3419_1 /TAXON_ID=464262 /ORGANISM="Genus nov. species nov., Strain RCC2339" /LENGTH=381 /DNA_ID=CAMNT_0007113317 /DNA_START=230 /DNA_END=1372 /DNA_ORIENTATION=+